MPKKTTYLIGIVVTIILGSLCHWYFCCKCCCDINCTHKAKKDLQIIKETPEIIVAPTVPTVKEDPPKTEETKQPVPEKIVFDSYGSGSSFDSLDENQRETLKELAAYLNRNPKATCLITGHTDSDGGAEFNKKLGLKRADYIKKQLINLKVDPMKIKTDSKGESEPLFTNDTPQGKAKNRRTDIIIN
ncbi:OmpA family protein [Flavobacteriaceae bacterium]|jgi:outer membrane protein OmpA-like peptidoglycan-associated protein|nr:OmpA family protein [Flavobacteriaceae bacterium]MDA9139336.1 OmpA family protein [Flavobacteriaceae bacterium]|tara:strand:- start:301 stop:864 length:564 start_codon:yes stop_codon:yes gene_type:complete